LRWKTLGQKWIGSFDLTGYVWRWPMRLARSSLSTSPGPPPHRAHLIRTDGARMFRVLGQEGYTHQYVSGYSSPEPGHVTLPGPHRVASLLKRWNAGTHHYRVEREHLQYYLDEFTFRFNRRRSKARGMLFYRLLQQSVNTDPHPLAELIGGIAANQRTEGLDVDPLPSNTFGEF
jgi:hypothetical protein